MLLAAALAAIALLATGDAARAQIIEVGPCQHILFALVQDVDQGQTVYLDVTETLYSDKHARLRAEEIGRAGLWRQVQGLRTFYPAHRVIRLAIAVACP